MTRIKFDLTADPKLRNLAVQLCDAVAPFLHDGKGVDVSKKVGVSPSVISIARNRGRLGQVMVAAGTALKICGGVPGGPRVIVEAGGFTYDITGFRTDEIYERMQKCILELQKRHDASLYYIEDLTGIPRKFLGYIRNGQKPDTQLQTLLSALEALDGDVYITIEEPSAITRQIARASLHSLESPMDSMIQLIRSACNTNIGFLSLKREEVAKEAEVDLVELDGFLTNIIPLRSMSRVFDIAKACKCEINLTVK